MHLKARFKRLSLWNKIAVIGAFASILGLACVLLPSPFGKLRAPAVQNETKQTNAGDQNIQAIGENISIQIAHSGREERRTVDLTGWWRLALVVESSSYNPYKGLRVAYKVHLLQDSARVQGRGEKWWENDKELPYSQHDPIEVEGTIHDARCTLGYLLKGRRRTTTGSFVFDLSQGRPPYEGTFSGTAADASGSVTLTRLRGQGMPNKALEGTR